MKYWLVSAALAITGLHADVKIVIKDGSATRVEYAKGKLYRMEFDQRGARIIDSANRRVITIDNDKRQYVVNQAGDRDPQPDPRRTLVIESETRDTGERRTMFGHEAIHLITTRRIYMQEETKPLSDTRQTVIDGWYIDLPGLPYRHGASASALYTMDVSGRPPTMKFVHTGANIPSLAIQEKINGETVREVIEISEATLDPKLFEVPSGYRRVIHPLPHERLPWTDQIMYYWQQFTDWFAPLIEALRNATGVGR